jgi:uncharacterized protein
MTSTDVQRFEIENPTDAERPIRARLEGPAGFATGTPLPCVIVLHGFKGFMDWGFFPELSRQLAGAGFACLSFNVSGSGIGQKLADFTDEEGFAKNTFSLEVRDLGLVRDLVDSGALTGIDATRCGVLGHSRGGGVALLNAAARGDYQAIVTWASICHIARFDAATVASWKRIGHILIPNARTGQDQRMDLAALEDAEQNRAALDIEGASARVAAPTLVVHGTADGSVDVSEGERLVAALPAGELFRIEGSGHTFEARHPFEGVSPGLAAALSASIAHFQRHLA